MPDWSDFAEASPELAERGFRLLTAGVKRDFDAGSWFGIGFLATTRPDGAPRLSPVCPIVSDGRMFVAAARPKTRDLERDPRFVLHAFLGEDDAEFAIRGRAYTVTDDRLLEGVKRVVAGTGMLADPQSAETVFELRVDEVHAAVWENVGQPGTRPIRTSWVPAGSD